MSIVREKDVVHKIFEEAQDRFGAISGGYTRIVKIGRRPGDAAPLTIIELVSSDDITPAPSKKAKPVADEKAVVTETQPASSDTPVDDAVDESVSEAAVEAKDADAADDSATLDATDDSTGKEKTKDVDNSAETEK
jgi:large subunit ribosomal protein L17